MRADIVDYTPAHHAAAVGLMAGLQDHEAAMHDTRPTGAGMAEAHFDHLLDCCAGMQGRVFVAELDGNAVGFVVVLVESEHSGARHLYERFTTYGMVTDLVVEEACRGSGVGAALLARAEDYLRDLGVASVRLSALAANTRAGDFYRRAGYDGYEITFLKEL